MWPVHPALTLPNALVNTVENILSAKYSFTNKIGTRSVKGIT